jgi:S-adenosylmethionine hydrolase
VAVVDPGVGSSRRGIAIRSARGDFLIGPDNGLLIPAVERLGGFIEAVELTRRDYWRSVTSATFHVRDVLGPVAGHLASGLPLERLGPPITELTRIELPRPNGLEGEVIHIDTYGNLVTNIPANSLPPQFAVRVNGRLSRGAEYYAAVEAGELLALVGSAGLLEISARDASAAALTGAIRGARVRVIPRPPPAQC